MSARHPNQREREELPVELRRAPVPQGVHEWIARATGQAPVRFRRLRGASTTAVHAVALADGHTLVLRRYVWPGVLEDEPVAPQREVDALRFARTHDLPVPEVVAADIEGRETGVPTLLMTRLPGQPTATPDLEQLAELAARFHSVDATGFGYEYFRWYGAEVRVPDRSTRPRLWEEAIEVWIHGEPAYPPTFIHRDFHPGNVLYARGRIGGIVDWANACQGPAGRDIAHARVNLVDWWDADAADRFQAAYERVTNTTFDPYWDLTSILEHEIDEWSEADLAEVEPRIERLLAELR